MNALKANGNIDDIKLLSKDIIKPIQILKTDYLKGNNPRLHTDEILIALAVESEKDDVCLKALKELHNLKNCEVHSTVILSEVDVKTFKKLGMRLTQEPVYSTKRLYHKK